MADCIDGRVLSHMAQDAFLVSWSLGCARDFCGREQRVKGEVFSGMKEGRSQHPHATVAEREETRPMDMAGPCSSLARVSRDGTPLPL